MFVINKIVIWYLENMTSSFFSLRLLPRVEIVELVVRTNVRGFWFFKLEQKFDLNARQCSWVTRKWQNWIEPEKCGDISYKGPFLYFTAMPGNGKIEQHQLTHYFRQHTSRIFFFISAKIFILIIMFSTALNVTKIGDNCYHFRFLRLVQS